MEEPPLSIHGEVMLSTASYPETSVMSSKGTWHTTAPRSSRFSLTNLGQMRQGNKFEQGSKPSKPSKPTTINI